MPNLAWTYTSLVNALQAWPVNSDAAYVADLDRIIGLGELRVVRDLNLEAFDKISVAVSTVIGTREVAKPADSVQLRSVVLVNGATLIDLEKRSYEYARLYAPVIATTGVPQFYSELSSGQIYITPTPDLVYVVNYRYVARPADSLNSGAPAVASWLSTNAPDLLFAACLMESEHYIKADDRYGDMKSKYYEELLPVVRAELRDSIRSGDYTPVQSAAQRA